MERKPGIRSIFHTPERPVKNRNRTDKNRQRPILSVLIGFGPVFPNQEIPRTGYGYGYAQKRQKTEPDRTLNH